jgi:CelD/BcsL family acetyltransferase involved in cellulose biosynthesis
MPVDPRTKEAENRPLQLELIDNPSRLCEFRTEWERFVRSVTTATPFQTPEWLFTWWAHFGSGRPQVFVFRADGETVGVVPCFLHVWKGRRQLTLIGSGITDYLDPPLDHRWSTAIVEVLGSYLTRRTEWDVCDWQDLSSASPLAILGQAREDTPCSRIRLATTFDDFLSARPKDLRRNLRRCRGKARSLDELHFEVSRTAEPELVTSLIDLHRERWRKTGECGMIEANRAAGFLRAAAETLATSGILRIFALRLQQQIAAIIMALRNSTTIFGYLSAFDPCFERFELGHELVARALEYAYSQHYCWWDFLRGEEQYKFDWGAERIAKSRVIIERR